MPKVENVMEILTHNGFIKGADNLYGDVVTWVN